MSVWALLGYAASAVVTFALVALSYVILRIKRTRKSFEHIPGPNVPSLLFGHAKEFQEHWTVNGTSAELLYDWQKKHGNTFVIHFLDTPWVVTTSPEAIKEVLVTGGHRKPADHYARISYVYGQRFLGKGIVTEADTEVWSGRRNILNPAFHKKYLRAMMAEFNSCGDEMIEALSKSADGKTMVKIGGYLHRATLDVIGKVAFNRDINSVQNAESPIPKAIFKAMYGFSDSVLDILWWFKPWEKSDFKMEVKQACQFLRKTCYDWLEDRRAAISRGDGVPEDILTLVLQAHGQNGKTMDVKHLEVILDDFVTMFVAGQETTANATSFALLEVGKHPDIFKKLKAEVDEVLGGRAEITFEDLTRLEYTGYVFKEALRLYPVGPVTFRELARDTMLDGYKVRKGTIVQVNFFCASRNPEYFDDPLEFKPERFSKENSRHSPYSFTPFSLGPRNCIGQNLAQMEGKVLLAKFVQRFNFNLDMTQSFDILEATTLRPKDGVRCTLTPRSEE